MRDLPPQTSPNQGAGNVVPIQPFQRHRSLSPLRQAEAYWLALCGPGALPRRSQIDPRGLANILDYSFILEQVAPRVARFRLAGQHLHELTGMEVRGLPFTALFADTARTDAGTALERVFSGPNVAELRLTQPGGAGRVAGEGRMLLLPLRTDEGDVSRALGVIVADGVGRSALPCRFDITDRLLRPAPGPAAPESLPERAGTAVPEQEVTPQGFAEAQVAFAGAEPHLRLVK